MAWLLLIAILFLPFIIGQFWARSIRMADYGWKVGLILFSLAYSLGVIWTALQPEQTITYAAKEGDTLQKIADQFGVMPTQLADKNNLISTAKLTPGQALRVQLPKTLKVQQGIDLSGGVILIYEVDEQKSAQASEVSNQAPSESAEDAGADAAGSMVNERVDIKALVSALGRRINPGGVKEVVIRPYGERQVEIIVPNVDESEIERIKNTITRAGFLKFMIVAQRSDRRHQRLIELAEAQPNARLVRDGKNVIGEWVRIGRDEEGRLRYGISGAELVREAQPGVIEILMVVDVFGVQGSHLGPATMGQDDKMGPAVDFTLNSQGSALFQGLTGDNLPDPQTGLYSLLGIVMDGELISAPRIQSVISDRGQITGNFTKEEVQMLVDVLRAGRLPAVLKPDPISENRISPLLGVDTIRKGKIAIVSSLIAVLAFMIAYYWFSGFVACFALLLNLLLVLAIMICIRGAFTLPGLAGLVLTVGMSVDANVLIFERIREEIRRGAALRMAIRNGFARATTTIVDANLTSLLTAFVLYAIGTDQIRGFAVTLILGILVSMYTAIFVSRVIFEIAERKRWIRKLTMLQMLSDTQIDFLGMKYAAIGGSLLLIAVGIGATVARGKNIFDIDFLGGTSVQARLREPMDYTTFRDRLRDVPDLTLTRMDAEGIPTNTVYNVYSSLQEVDQLKDLIGKLFQAENGETMFVTHTVSYEPPTEVTEAEVKAGSSSPAVGGDATSAASPAAPLPTGPATAITSPAEVSSEADIPDAEKNSVPGSSGTTDESSDSAQKPATTPGEGQQRPDADEGARGDLPADNLLAYAGDVALSQAILAQAAVGEVAAASKSKVTFDERVTRSTLLEAIRTAADQAGVSEPTVTLTGPAGESDSAAGFTQWTVQADVSTAQLDAILTILKTRLENQPAWLASSKIGSAVAGNTTNMALVAIVFSLICIVAYLWLRFQKVSYGLAAAVALVHDVLVTVGAIALSYWLAGPLGFLQIEEFKISLPVVASLLTIIGYSLNDTIVIFDRIREVRGKNPQLTEEMVNNSINQTLSRTLLTSLTTLIVVVVLYAFGGQGIHGFAFALLVGVVAGTYSTVFIASPFLLWMRGQLDKKGKNKIVTSRPVTAKS